VVYNDVNCAVLTISEMFKEFMAVNIASAITDHAMLYIITTVL